jgi:hypothetical protein
VRRTYDHFARLKPEPFRTEFARRISTPVAMLRDREQGGSLLRTQVPRTSTRRPNAAWHRCDALQHRCVAGWHRCHASWLSKIANFLDPGADDCCRGTTPLRKSWFAFSRCWLSTWRRHAASRRCCAAFVPSCLRRCAAERHRSVAGRLRCGAGRNASEDDTPRCDANKHFPSACLHCPKAGMHWPGACSHCPKADMHSPGAEQLRSGCFEPGNA